MLHDGPYSQWAVDLFNTEAFDFRPVGWDEILDKQSFGSSLAVLTAGDEYLAAGRDDAEAIAKLLRKHLQDGNTILVLAGGAYPAYHPDESELAKTFGFELEFVQFLADGKVKPAGSFTKSIKSWTPDRNRKSRLMTERLYPNAKSYESLVKVYGPEGDYIGDAVSVVQPGGEFDDGTVIYLAEGMTKYEDRETLLNEVLKVVHQSIN